MKKTNLTHAGPFAGHFKFFVLLLPLFFAAPSLFSQTCNPAAEFSYNASQFCQNGTNPVLTHTTGAAGTFTDSVISGGPTLDLNAQTGAINLSTSDPGVYKVTNVVGNLGSMVITGILDGPLSGGTPKAIEFYVLADIPNLNQYRFSNFNNGSTTPTATFIFPNVAVAAGTRIWVATEIPNFTAYFGFPPTYTSNAINVNGNDAVRLFFGTQILDVFGEVGVNGTGTFWDYLDGWAYRVSNTGPDGDNFIQANWTFSGTDALDNTTTNATAPLPWPIGTYVGASGTGLTCSVTIEVVAPPAAEAGPNQLLCEGTTIILSATGSGSWSGGAGVFSSITDPNATYTPSPAEIGTTVSLSWTVQSTGGVCVSATDVVNITILEGGADAEFSYDAALYCPNGADPILSHTTGTDGRYSYIATPSSAILALDSVTGAINLAMSDIGTYEVTNGVSGCGNLVISGVIDGPITGGLPKAVEFYALSDIPDLSAYGFGSANNGGGTDGQEFTFPTVAVDQGTSFWVATESVAFTAFFGFPPTFVANLAASINGDDAIELFCNGVVIDVFGEISYAPGQFLPWNYRDGWAYRVNNTGPDGSFFELGNWFFSGPDALDNFPTNAAATNPFPIDTFTSTVGPICPNDFDTVTITINDTEAPVISCPASIVVTLNPGECAAAINFNVTATDNCDPDPTISQSAGGPSGSFFEIGTHTVTFTATDLLGNVSTCTFEVTVNEFPNPTSTLTCNNFVQASIGQNGTAIIGADMVLEGGPYGCYDDYLVEFFTGAGVSVGNFLDCSHIGSVFTVKVTDPETGNSCWGQIIVEDKLPPVINCMDRTVSCTQNIDLVPKPTVTDNCDNFPTLNLVELVLIDNDACDDNQVQYRRTWIAFDKYGNTSQPCQEIITVTRPAGVHFPEDITWTCAQYALRPNIINATKLHPSIIDTDPSDPDIDVNPNLPLSILSNTGSGIPSNIDGEFCQYGYIHADEILEFCGGAPGVLKIVRTWTVLDWCTGQIITTGVNGEDNIQVIKVVDTEAPVIPSVGIMQVNANVPGVHPQLCRSTELISVPAIFDNCSGVAEVHIFTPIGEAPGGFIPSPGLPLGNHTITITATDMCGNFSSKDFTLQVVDLVAPVAICDKITDVNLSSDGIAEVFAETFDDGSHDNCCIEKFEVRRMTDPCDDGHNDLVFGPSVRFCCNDVANNPIMVVFRVYDCHGNFNDCMVEVYVQDKISPVLISCPPNQRITCDFYAENLETQLAQLSSAAARSQFLDPFFGAPVFQDNCNPNLNRNFSSNIDQCLEGTITRSWTATDDAGNTSTTCNQTIFIDHVSDWVVEFPADITVTCGTQVPEFGEPKIFFETCELVGVSFLDEVFNTVPDACYKILRTWTIINWCVVGAEIDQEVIESSEREFQLAGILPFPQCDFDGDGDCDTRTFRDSWRVSPLATPGAADANTQFGPDTDPDSDPWDGYIVYQQTIKVIDNVDPVFVNGCPIPEVCITESFCSATLLLPTPDVDDCSSNVTISAQIQIGGTAVSGFGPFNNVGPGTYDVTYTAIDNCNNQAVCHTTVQVKDCKKPTPYCLNGIVTTLMATNPPMVEVWASDLDAGSFDNCTASGNLIFSFSENVNETSFTFHCNNIGFSLVNIWVTDEAGNQDFCQTSVIIEDNMNVCNDPLISMGGLITNDNGQGIQDVSVFLSGTSSDMAMSNADGMYQFAAIVPGGDYTILPVKDINPLNGVTTFDLVLITKHILGTQLLDSPYKIIAADANNSKTVTTFDLVELRKLILFIYDELPNNSSWRFVKKDFVFPNPANPWQTTFPELVNMNDVVQSQMNINFRGIKIGDVNGSALPNQLIPGSDDRNTGGTLIFETENISVKKGRMFNVPFKVSGSDVTGFQFTLNFDPAILDFVSVSPGLVSEDNFGLMLLRQGAVTASWNLHDGSAQRLEGEVFGLTFTAKIDGKLSDLLQLNSRFTKAEAYNADLEWMDVALQFENQPATSGFELFQNTPNPFSDFTVIGFQLPEAAHATLTVMDISGRTIKVLNAEFSRGYNEVKFRRDELKASGVLYYRLETKDFTATRKMVLMD